MNLRKRLIKLIETELTAVLAVIIILGMVIGYSLAATTMVTSTHNLARVGAETDLPK